MKMAYIVSRGAVAAVFSGILYAGGLTWWIAALVGVLTFAFFLAAPRSGRYVVQGDGIAPLRRDERSGAIRDKAARNAFVVTILAVAGLTVAYGRVLDAAIPVSALSGILGLAAVAYAISELCLRRSS
jgi:polyferredoxin